MKGIRFEKCPPQHVIYGPSAPIASKLTADNWQECAILRAKQYLYVASGRWLGTGDDSLCYRVNTSPNDDLSRDFARLDEAIDYANHLGKPDKELPFKPSSGTYVGVQFGNDRIGWEIPLKQEKSND